jgi:1-acyl-sn-glycerol-3-phosphate acyltransferase
MKLGKVEKRSNFYALLRFWGKFIHDFFFYRKVTVIGLENIPKDKPVLVAPNHQNALMDALAVIYAQNIQPVFLARSDIFKNPLVAKFLFKIKILPVFRIRDGKDKMKYNDLIYAKSIEVLEHKRQVVIFPEAQHIDKKHVRPLKKGIQRIAFMLEEKNDFKADVHIVPAGIYYSNYWNFRSDVLVKFGKAISLKPYLDDYKADPPRTLIKFSDILHKKILEQVIHIQDLDYHDEYDYMLDIYDEKIFEEYGLKDKPENKLFADRETVKRLDELKEKDESRFKSFTEKISSYSTKIKELGIKDWAVSSSGKLNYLLPKIVLLLAASPVFVYGLIHNIIPYLLPNLITKNIKDRQFTSSVSYGFAIFLFPFVYLIQFAIVWIFVKIWYVALIYLFTAPLFGLLAFMIHRLFIKVKTSLRYKFFINKDTIKDLENLRGEIINLVEDR